MANTKKMTKAQMFAQIKANHNLSADPNRMFSITEIIKEVPECADLTNQRVSAIVRGLIDSKVERIEEKRKAFFRAIR